jgi:Ca2+-transporting ATPase
MAKIIDDGGRFLLCAKGAPSVITGHAENHDEYDFVIHNESKRGLRLIATLTKELSKNEVQEIVNGKNTAEMLCDGKVNGVIGFADPLRETVRESINKAREAGVRVILITGDHPETAKSIATQAGLFYKGDKALVGKEIARMSDGELQRVVRNVSVYARILPQDKLRIIKALKDNGEVVAMTGDGVNDAPALKQADVGIAVGSGTDVAREASDIILLDDNVETIVQAIKEGRVILDNVQKMSVYLLKDSFSEVLLLGTAIIFGLPLPITAAQILWINIVEDAFPAFSFAYEPGEKNVLKRKPYGKKAALFSKKTVTLIFGMTLIGDAVLLMLFFGLLFVADTPIDQIRTIMFTVLALNSLFLVFSLKNLHQSLLKIDLFSNLPLIGSVIFGAVALGVALFIPPVREFLGMGEVTGPMFIGITLFSISQLVLLELVKKYSASRDTALKFAT